MIFYKCLNCPQTSSSFTFLCDSCGGKMALLEEYKNPSNVEKKPFTHIPKLKVVNAHNDEIEVTKDDVHMLYKSRESLDRKVQEISQENDKLKKQEILYEERIEKLKVNDRDLNKQLTKAQSNICVLNAQDDKLYFENKKLKEIIELYKTIIEKLGD